MKKINITFSFPSETHARLKALIENQKMSIFFSEAVNKALDERIEMLKLAYQEAENDPDRKEVIEDWKHLDV